MKWRFGREEDLESEGSEVVDSRVVASGGPSHQESDDDEVAYDKDPIGAGPMRLSLIHI